MSEEKEKIYEGNTIYPLSNDINTKVATIFPSKEEIILALASRKRTPQFPTYSSRNIWSKIAKDIRHKTTIESIITLSTSRLEKPWPKLVVSDYLAFKKSGNRRVYEIPYFERRDRLGTTAIAFALTEDERFLHDVANGIWLLCDEMTWCLPSHIKSSTIDIFVCQTAQLLAETCTLLAEPLAIYAPAVVQRAKDVVRERVIDPILVGGYWWWMSAGRSNWASWCASGISAAAYWCEDDNNRLGQILYKMMRIGEKFIAAYPDDGGCDEGVHYWIPATGSLINLFETINHATGISLYSDPKLLKMVRFLVVMHLGGGIFPAFSDSTPIVKLPIGICWRAAIRTNCSELREMLIGLPLIKVDSKSKSNNTISDALINILRLFFWTDDTYIPKESLTIVDKNNWLPNTQILVAQSNRTALAVKGGHNNENHNNNDVGQFVVYHKGKPIIVDAGRDTYTKTTFGVDRFILWWARGSGHNAPVIGNHEQQYGRQYEARKVRYNNNETSVSFSADLANCYETNAGVIELIRDVALDHSNGIVTIVDHIRQKTEHTITINLLTAVKPIIKENTTHIGTMLLEFKGGKIESVKQIDLDNGNVLAASWPGGLWRIRLIAIPGLVGEWKIILKPT